MTDFADNSAANRYEMNVNGTVAFIDYVLQGDTINLTHTEVPQALSGQGVGSRLVKQTLNHIRGRGLKVVPSCSFIHGYIGKHPEYQDLVASNG